MMVGPCEHPLGVWELLLCAFASPTSIQCTRSEENEEHKLLVFHFMGVWNLATAPSSVKQTTSTKVDDPLVALITQAKCESSTKLLGANRFRICQIIQSMYLGRRSHFKSCIYCPCWYD